jgi:hypothetical protein
MKKSQNMLVCALFASAEWFGWKGKQSCAPAIKEY